MNILRTALLIAPVILVAQDAKPAAYADLFRNESPAIEKMITELQVVDALQKLETMIGDGKLDAFDKVTPGGTYASHLRYYWAARAYFTAGRAAQAAGQWEKALTYYKKGLDLAKENSAASKEAFDKHIKDYEYDIRAKQGFLEGNADYIKELRAKTAPNDDDKRQLAEVKAQEDAIATNQKWIGNFKQSVQRAESEVKLFEPFAPALEEALKDETKRLEEYKFKNDKVKFVEGYASSKGFIDQIKAGDKAQGLANLYRLSVLDPENKKIKREIDAMLGKTPEPEAPAAKGGKKKK